MADIKISELEPTTDLEGLYTLGSDKNNLSKKVSLQFLKTAADYANTQGDYAKGVADGIAGLLGIEEYSQFSESVEYPALTVVMYNGQLYRFTQTHYAGAWLGTDVEKTSVKGVIRSVGLGNRTNEDVTTTMALRKRVDYDRYVGSLKIKVGDQEYSGTILNISADSYNEIDGYPELKVRFFVGTTLYEALNEGSTAWQISKVTDVAEWEQKLAQLDQRLIDVEENGGGESGMFKEDTSSNILNITDEEGNILASWDEKGGFIAKAINQDLKGIKVFCVGDSITYGQGLSSPTTQRWSAQLADMFEWDLVVKAEGGIPLSCYTSNNGKTCVNFIDTLATMSEKPDLILVWGGHNDSSYRPSPYGDFKDIATQDTAGALATYADRKSFCGALRYIAEVCHNYAPNAKVYFLTLLNGGASNPFVQMSLTPDKTRDDMVKAIYDAGRLFQCGVIDMGMCGINAVSGVSGNLTSDGTHPNAAGTKQIVNYLANYLNNNFVKVE